MSWTRHGPWLAVVLSLTVAIALGSLHMRAGVPPLDTGELVDVLLRGGGDERTRLVVLQLRLPRVMLAVLAGASLGASGWILQTALRNPLAGPELLGVGAGASLAIALVVFLGVPLAFGALPVVALVGGLAAGLLVLSAVPLRAKPSVVVLVGAAVNLFAWAAITVVLSLAVRAGDVALFYQYIVGTLSGRTWRHVIVAMPWVVVVLPLAIAFGRLLDLLTLGDDVAEGLGLRVERARLGFLVVGAALVSGVVAVAGPIAWVALISPHLARATVGSRRSRTMIPISAGVGALLLLGADTAARAAFENTDLPVGIWTAVVGGPMLLVLVRRRIVGAAA